MSMTGLTRSTGAVTNRSDMNEGQRMWGKMAGLMGVAPILLLGGCISVDVPDEPIVIELNINIRQEVIYRLAEDAADTIDENADIF